MPIPRNQIPDGVEEKLLALFDETLESETGNIHYRCGPDRAKYLHRWAAFLRDSSAVSSVDTFSPDHPLYGLGVYWNLETIPTKYGLLLRIVEEPRLSPSQLLLRTAIRRKNYCVECDDTQTAQSLISAISAAAKSLMRKGIEPSLLQPVKFHITGTAVHVNYEHKNKNGIQVLTDAEVEALLEDRYQTISSSTDPNDDRENDGPEDGDLL